MARRRHRCGPRPHLRSQHEPDRGGVRGEAADARRRRGGHVGVDGHGRDLQHALRPARAGPAGGVGEGHLRRHQHAVHQVPPEGRGGGRAGRHDRRRRRRAGDGPGLRPALPRDAHQPDVEDHRPAAPARRRPRPRRGDRGRQHVRHAGAPAAAGAGRRPRGAQRHQVPRGPCRCARWRGRRARRSGRGGVPLPGDQRRDPPSGGGLSPPAGDEDAPSARRAAVGQRDGGRRVPRRAPEGDDGQLSGSGEPPRPRDREAADVRLGRDAELRARRRNSTP